MPAEIHPIILNQNNNVDDNTYTYTFSKGASHLKGASIALSECNIFYSWQNITARFNNNSFSIIFPDNSVPTFSLYDITIPDGNYTVEDLNQFLQQWQIDNKKYLVNNTSLKNYYFIELVTRPHTYQIQLIMYDIPTALPVGYSNPAGMVFPAVVSKASLVLKNNKFGDLIGFESNSVYFSALSTKTPQMSPISSILMSCNLVNSGFSNPSNILYSFVSGSTEYGRMISVQNQSIEFLKIPDGVYRELTIKFMDDKFRPLIIKDHSLIIYLLIKIETP